MQTRREQILDLLENAEGPLTADEICRALDIRERTPIYQDIEHISRTVKAKGGILLIKAASCGKCGFIFRRRSAKPASRCPKCHSEWILPPAYVLRKSK